ncbi:MAG: hypothetical protein K6G61_05645 [Solobacterium sp.]|nr:hypothetical protein [Solobacterium sp.]
MKKNILYMMLCILLAGCTAKTQQLSSVSETGTPEQQTAEETVGTDTSEEEGVLEAPPSEEPEEETEDAEIIEEGTEEPEEPEEPEKEVQVCEAQGVIELIAEDRKTLYISVPAGEESVPALIADNGVPKELAAGDTVTVKYEIRTVQTEDKDAEEYHLIYIERSDAMYQDGYALSDFITFTPSSAEIIRWVDTTEEGQPFSMDNMKEVSETFEDPAAIAEIIGKLDQVYAYTDGTVPNGTGDYPFTLILRDGENEVIITEQLSVTVSHGGEQTVLYYKNDQETYLSDMFN